MNWFIIMIAAFIISFLIYIIAFIVKIVGMNDAWKEGKKIIQTDIVETVEEIKKRTD